MQTKSIALISVFLGLITTGCLIGGAASKATGGADSPNTSSAATTASVFKTPEDAIHFYMEGVAQSDIQKIIQACAINEMSEKFNFKLYVDRLGGVFLPFQSMAPTDYAINVETNKIQKEAEILNSVRYFTYRLLANDIVADSSSMMSHLDTTKVNSFITEVDPKRLTDIKILEIALPDKTLMSDPKYRETAAKNALIYGADEQTERVALFSFEQNYYYVGFTLFRYGEGWKISALTSSMANIDPLAAVKKTTVDEFDSMINR